MNTLTEPIVFEPILKSKIWGGQKLNKLFNKKSDAPDIGESWEISDVEGDTSIVALGKHKNQSLKTLINTYKGDLMGEKNYTRFGNKFPLLIKFIDAKQDLSIQLHPNDKLAAERHNSFGKTEMWHVLEAKKESNLIVGFKSQIDRETYLQHVKNKTLPQALNFDQVNPGDTYFIKTGLVHAIGAGVVLAEIQQTSDITYRIYDWDRKDQDGNERELHNDLAIDAIDFEAKNDFRVNYSKTKNAQNKLVSCPYFTTNYLHLDEKISKTKTVDSFLIYICTEGSAEIKTPNSSTKLSKGSTVLIPASLKQFDLVTKNAKLLEVYV